MNWTEGSIGLFFRTFGPTRRAADRPKRMRQRKPLDVTEVEWRSLRAQVFDRDSFTCVYCRAAPPRRELQADHVLARARGGKSTLDNLATACRPCNLAKAAKLLAEWRESDT